MPQLKAVLTDKAPKPLPQFSQAVTYGGMVYCSGNIGLDPETFKFVEGGVKEQTVCDYFAVVDPLPLESEDGV